MPDTPPMSRLESDTERSARQSRTLWRRVCNWLRVLNGKRPEDEPDYDPRRADASCPGCVERDDLLRDAGRLEADLRRRVHELEAERENLGEDLNPPLGISVVTPMQYLTEYAGSPRPPVEVGAREPGKQAKAPFWTPAKAEPLVATRKRDGKMRRMGEPRATRAAREIGEETP